MSRVFIPTRKTKFELHNLKGFGEPVYLFDGKPPSPLKLQNAYEAVDQRLEALEYNPTEDYVAVMGPNIYVVLIVLSACGYGDLKMLLFDAVNDQYVARPLRLEVE